MPASASPSWILDRVALTSISLLTGVTLSLALVSALRAVLPQGTASSQSTTLTPGLARSDSWVMPAGLAGGTAISITFLANVLGSVAALAATTWSMFFAEAEANTSAGAPD